MSDELVDAIAEMRDEEAIELARQLLDGGTPPLEVLEDCRKAMAIVGPALRGRGVLHPGAHPGRRDAPGHIRDRQAADDRLATIPLRTARSSSARSRATFMTSARTSFPSCSTSTASRSSTSAWTCRPESFVAKVREVRARNRGAERVPHAVLRRDEGDGRGAAAAGLRDDVKIMIGGGTVDDNVREYAHADAYGSTATDAVNLAKNWTGVEAR